MAADRSVLIPLEMPAPTPGDEGRLGASLPWVDNKTILTPTSGFLGTGYTHTINVYHGCAFAGSLCGTFCDAQHDQWITKGRPWGI
jgi:hypothetical protein